MKIAEGILSNDKLSQVFSDFFSRQDTFTLGIDRGAHFLTQIKDMIPGAVAWPNLSKNISGKYEARLLMTELPISNCIFTKGMHGSKLPIVILHACGMAQFVSNGLACNLSESEQLVLNHTSLKEPICYPDNPDGSHLNTAGFSSSCGRVFALMPRLDCSFRSVQLSWHPRSGEDFLHGCRFFTMLGSGLVINV